MKFTPLQIAITAGLVLAAGMAYSKQDETPAPQPDDEPSPEPQYRTTATLRFHTGGMDGARQAQTFLADNFGRMVSSSQKAVASEFGQTFTLTNIYISPTKPSLEAGYEDEFDGDDSDEPAEILVTSVEPV